MAAAGQSSHSLPRAATSFTPVRAPTILKTANCCRAPRGRKIPSCGPAIFASLLATSPWLPNGATGSSTPSRSPAIRPPAAELTAAATFTTSRSHISFNRLRKWRGGRNLQLLPHPAFSLSSVTKAALGAPPSPPRGVVITSECLRWRAVGAYIVRARDLQFARLPFPRGEHYLFSPYTSFTSAAMRSTCP